MSIAQCQLFTFHFYLKSQYKSSIIQISKTPIVTYDIQHSKVKKYSNQLVSKSKVPNCFSKQNYSI